MPGLIHLYKKSFSNLNPKVWILSLVMFINRSGSMVLLFTSLYMTRELGYTIKEAGWVMSFYGIGSVLGSYLGGWLSDRYRAVEVMLWSLVISGLVLTGLLLVKSFIGLSVVIFIYALSADVFRPANSKSIALYSKPQNRTRSVSLVRLAVNLGFTVGPAIGGFIALYLGYHWLFVIDAATTFLAAAVLWKYLPPVDAQVRLKEKDVLTEASTSAYRDINYLVFILFVAVYATCFFQIFASVPQYFNRVCHYDEDTIGLLMALNGLIVVLVEMPFIQMMEHRREVFLFIVVGALCLPVSFAILLFGGDFIIGAVLYTFVITFSEIFAMPYMMNYSLNRPRAERQGQYSALYSIAYGIANIAAPVIGLGTASRIGFNGMFVVLIVLGLCTAIGFFVLGRRHSGG
jgi:predicted MFS family arabinose efflux permease